MKQTRRSSALIELIIIICFMAIALTVVVQLFAEVYTRNKSIAGQSNAIVAMQDCAEQYKADPLSAVPGEIYYSDDFTDQLSQGTSSQYVRLTVETTAYAAGTLYEFRFTAFQEDAEGAAQEIAQLTAARYLPTEGGAVDE